MMEEVDGSVEGETSSVEGLDEKVKDLAVGSHDGGAGSIVSMTNCPLCECDLSEISVSQPSCKSCPFNICSLCIEKLHVASKETSDEILCPNCRDGAFDKHSRDAVATRENLECAGLMDEELSATQIRLRYSSWTSINLASKSFEEIVVPDDIFRGLEGTMDAEERENVYGLLSSGDVSSVLKAVTILHGIEEMIMDGKTKAPPQDRASPLPSLARSTKRANTKTGWSSNEGAAGGRNFEEFKKMLFGPFARINGGKGERGDSSSDEECHAEPSVVQSAPPARSFKTLPYPELPRMPFAVNLSTSEVKLGSRLGIRNNLDMGIVFEAADPCNGRVQRVYGQAARKGILVSDVFTHLEGEPVTGKEMGKLLQAALKEKEQVVVGFNCNQITADKLKRRADEINLMHEL